MPLETGTYISDLNPANPTGTDPKSQGDDHLRLIKSTVKTTFPNITGAVTPTHTVLNYMLGVTSSVQTQLNARGLHAGQTWTGTHNFTGATITVPTATAGTNSTVAASTAFVDASFAKKAGATYTGAHDFTGATVTAPTQSSTDDSTSVATTAFVQSVAFATAVPSQGGNGGKWLTTDGTNASWQFLPSTAPAVIIQNQQPSGTAGALLSTSAWNTRVLNTVVRNVGSVASLASNAFTLPAGIWMIRGRAASVGNSVVGRLRFYDVTAGAAITPSGVNVLMAGGGGNSGAELSVTVVVTLAGSTTIRLEHYTTGSTADGQAASTGDPEVYATVEVTRMQS